MCLWRLYWRGICGVCGCGVCGCGQCRWWIGLCGLYGRGYLWNWNAGLVEVNVGAVYGWCINSK